MGKVSKGVNYSLTVLKRVEDYCRANPTDEKGKPMSLSKAARNSGVGEANFYYHRKIVAMSGSEVQKDLKAQRMQEAEERRKEYKEEKMKEVKQPVEEIEDEPEEQTEGMVRMFVIDGTVSQITEILRNLYGVA